MMKNIQALLGLVALATLLTQFAPGGPIDPEPAQTPPTHDGSWS